jgi:beta-lactamase class A
VKRGSYTTLRWISIILIFAAVLLIVFQLVRYSRLRSSFPSGTTIAGIAVGGLDLQLAADRIIQAYSVPIEVHYGDAVIQIKPGNLGFKLNVESMITAADIQRVQQPFWVAFWGFLWNRLPSPITVPLDADISEDQLKAYLMNEIASRYDTPPQAAIPVPGSVAFQPGVAGKVLDIDQATTIIESALRSPSSRVVNLSYTSVPPSRPSFSNLEVLLKQIIDASGFDGITEMYVLDLQGGQEIHFAYQLGESLEPGIAFTAASTIKIPIMVSIFRHITEPASTAVSSLLEQMIEQSKNDPADLLMQQVLDQNLGPLIVTDDMRSLGLKSTFLAGYFAIGSPLLQNIITPANSRTDIDTSPDRYNQTTPAEMGMLLEDIYQCANDGGGAFAVVFPNEITQTECQTMISYLLKNKIAVLMQAGLPDGAQFAHKHGWIVELDGVIHHISDAGIVFSPGGDYVIAIYMYQPVQLIFDVGNALFADLSTAVYNYYNVTNQ